MQTGMTGRTRPTNSLKGPALKLHTQLTRRTLDAASRRRCTAGRIPAITLVRVLLWEFLGRGLDECLSFACFTSVGQSVDPHSCSLFFLCPHEGGWLRNPTPGPATSTVTVQGLSANTCYNIGVYQYASSYGGTNQLTVEGNTYSTSTSGSATNPETWSGSATSTPICTSSIATSSQKT